MYLMPWKFVCDLKFHKVLQTTINRQITKGNKEIKKIEKYSQKPMELCTNLYVCANAHAHACAGYCSVLLCVNV